MAPITANPAGDPARAHDLTRLRELTKPHLPNPGAPIQQALPHMGPADVVEVIAILGRINVVADDLGAWLVGLLADAGRKKLTALVMGGYQERALRDRVAARLPGLLME
jgi:hypothetical protein